jgi:hypothetical protein
LLQSRCPLAQRNSRDGSEAFRVHGGSANLPDRQVGCRTDGVDHDAGKRSLPQLADNEAQQELLFRGGRAREQSAQRLRAQRRGTGSAHSGDGR